MRPEPGHRADRGSADQVHDPEVVHLPPPRPQLDEDAVVDLRPGAGASDAAPSLFPPRPPIEATADPATPGANGVGPLAAGIPLPPNDPRAHVVVPAEPAADDPASTAHGSGPADVWPLEDPPTIFATAAPDHPPAGRPADDPSAPPPPSPPTPPAPTPPGVDRSESTSPGTPVRPAVPPVERRSPEVVATAPRAAPGLDEVPPEPAGPASASGSLAARTMRVLAPVVLVLVVAAVLAVGLTARAATTQSSADRLSSAAAAERARQRTIDATWSAVLASVAGGVGQAVQDAEDVSELVGGLAAEPVGEPAEQASDEAAAASSASDRFATQVQDALDRAAGSPVELGNELESLEAAHGEALVASTDLIERLEDLAGDARGDAQRWRWSSLLVLVLGVVGALLLSVLARRRLRAGLDRPVADLHAAVARVGGASPNGPVTVRGYAELAELGVELDRHTAGLRAQLARLRRRAAWGEQSRRIFEALDLAEDEQATHDVVSQALAGMGTDHPVELLLAERGTTSLHRVAANPAVAPPGCPVDAVAGCVALRRAQVSVFDDSTSINACPKLRDHEGGPCSAVCVPVSVTGRPVGVLHVTGPQGAPPQGEVVEQLVDLSTQLGTRLSALRALERSRHEASTDGLTGLPNRRTLESEVAELFERGTPFVMVLADLDRFKLLNDNFGHEVGDRALQLFAGVLRDNVRGNDVVARLGGEEFVLVYPNMSTEISLEAIDRVRGALATALAGTNLPTFTCSFGIAHSDVAADGDAVLRVADAGLLQAKDLGGDQAVVADADLAQQIFREGAPLRSRRDEHR